MSTGLHSHIKVMALGRDIAAMSLWVLGLSWVTEQETDGRITAQVVAKICSLRPDRGRNWAEALVRVGLWEGSWRKGYVFHDFLDWQKSRSELAELRRSKRRAGYLGGKASGKSRVEAKSKQVLEAKRTHVSSPLLSTPQSHSAASPEAPAGAAPPATNPEEVAHATDSDSEETPATPAEVAALLDGLTARLATGNGQHGSLPTEPPIEATRAMARQRLAEWEARQERGA